MVYRQFVHLRMGYIHDPRIIEANLIKIRSLTCSPLLKCRGMGDLRKSYNGVHASGYDLRFLIKRKVAL